MNTSNIFDITLVAGLSALVLTGLISAGMTTAIATGSVIGGLYMLTK